MNKFTPKSFPGVKNAGFTLIELLVVVLIIGILASVALPQYTRAVLRARYTELQTLARSFASAAERYYLANGTLPDYWADLDLDVPGGCSASDTVREGYMVCRQGTVSCDLLMSSTPVVVCFFKRGASSFPLAHAEYFDNRPVRRECWADPANADANAVCKAAGGVENGSITHTHCPSSRCTRYSL